MLASLLHITSTATTIFSPSSDYHLLLLLFYPLHKMDPRGFGRYPSMNEMQNRYMYTTGQRQQALRHYNSAEILGPHGTGWRGWWNGTRESNDPSRHYRLARGAQIYDMGSGGQFLNFLDGYSGWGPPGQSLFGHHLSRQLDPLATGFDFHNMAERHRTSMGNNSAQSQMMGQGVRGNDFATRHYRW